MKSRLRLDLLLVTCGGLFLLLLAYERTTVVEHRRPSVYSSYDRGPNGYAALYEVLRTDGVPVRRFERVVAVLDSDVKTLVITSYENDPNRKPLDRHDAAVLRDFVAKGGRLVAIDTDFAGKLDVTPRVGTTLQTPGGSDAIALARNAYTENVRRVRGTIDWTFSFKEALGVPLLANRDGMVAVWYRYGRGEIIAITAPALLGNGQLRNADNVVFAYNAIAGHGPVAFNEYVHGYSDNLSIWGALPVPVRAAVWTVLAIAIIALIGANVPFAPPFRLDVRDERDSSDYIAAIAELMRRSRRRPGDKHVLRQARVDFQERKEHA